MVLFKYYINFNYGFSALNLSMILKRRGHKVYPS